MAEKKKTRVKCRCPKCNHNAFSFRTENSQDISLSGKKVRYGDEDAQTFSRIGEVISVHCKYCGYRIPEFFWSQWNWE